MSGGSNEDREDRSRPRTPGPGSLTRERVVAAAIAFVDEHSLTALTMRRLGKELGVEAMSIYRYVNGREDLLEGIVDDLVSQLHLRPRHRTPWARRRVAGLPAVARARGPRPGS